MKKIFRHIIFYLIITLTLSSISVAQEPILGVVVNVASGDTVTVWEKGKQYIIRLYGIDIPDDKQNFGQKAKKFTSDLVFNKDLIVIPKGIDQYGRIIGIIYIGKKCLNEEIIKKGLSWVSRTDCNEPSVCEIWLELETSAKNNKLGLWID